MSAHECVDVTGLEPDAVLVVREVVERLRMGRKQYGALALVTDPRDFVHEAHEELLDATVYLAAETLRKRGAKP